MSAAESGSLFESQEKAPSPPPPPPPPPARSFERAHSAMVALPSRESLRGGDVPRDAAEAIARVAVLADRLMGIERELVELQVFRRKVELGGNAGASHADHRSTVSDAEIALLKSENEKLRQQVGQGGDPGERQRLQRELDAARTEAVQAREEASRAQAELEQQARAAGDVSSLKTENERLVKEVERIEGELQSLKLLREQQARRMQQTAQQALAGLEGMALDPKIEARLKAIVEERDRLAEEKQKLDADLSRIKSEATKKIKELKGDLDRKAGESETMRLQKDNLLRQLMARDAGEAPARELTLEEITNSQVFKDMLGNIRRTSREEVTHLHDAIASLKDVDPKAYNLCLDVVSKQFRKAAMENPLAMLPRG